MTIEFDMRMVRSGDIKEILHVNDKTYIHLQSSSAIAEPEYVVIEDKEGDYYHNIRDQLTNEDTWVDLDVEEEEE